MLDSICFTRLFVSERKQIAMIADEKSPARISHRIFATRSLRNVGNGMNEKSLEVLKQYDFEVNRVLRGRGGMILNTDRGVKLFLECVKSDKYYESMPKHTKLSEIYCDNAATIQHIKICLMYLMKNINKL